MPAVHLIIDLHLGLAAVRRDILRRGRDIAPCRISNGCKSVDEEIDVIIIMIMKINCKKNEHLSLKAEGAFFRIYRGLALIVLYLSMYDCGE